MQKKVCLLGSFSVGKTSLAARFVRSIFSDKYHTTVGVKVDKKVLELDGRTVTLMIWDLAGEDAFNRVEATHMRGAAGCFLVVDGTRQATLDKAYELRRRIDEAIGSIPSVWLFNKSDLREEWEVDDAAVREIRERGETCFLTSAKTGENVEEAFMELARVTVAPGK